MRRTIQAAEQTPLDSDINPSVLLSGLLQYLNRLLESRNLLLYRIDDGPSLLERRLRPCFVLESHPTVRANFKQGRRHRFYV